MPIQSQYQFIKRRKFHCPSCNHKRFVRYVDVNTGQELPEEYGRCDREESCQYWLSPYENGYAREQWFKERGMTAEKPLIKPHKPPKAKPLVYYPPEVLKATLSGYEENIFIQNLLSRIPFPFEVEDVERVIRLYCLGTMTKGYMKGAVTFPFIDRKGNTRAIQVKQFDETNHTKRTNNIHALTEQYCKQKEKPLPDWLKAYKGNSLYFSCLFGEHLLPRYPGKAVALVEAPKTAVYACLYFGFPEAAAGLLWLGVYNLSSLTFDRCKVLQGRNVHLFPDLSKDGSAYQQWKEKANRWNAELPDTHFEVSPLLEQHASPEQREKGADLADYLIALDWREFR